ncbi:hypothetical protein BD410DRAFT_786270, partial [Rickenella mellea]
MPNSQNFSLSSIASTPTELHVNVARQQITWLKDRNDVENCLEYGFRVVAATSIL